MALKGLLKGIGMIIGGPMKATYRVSILGIAIAGIAVLTKPTMESFDLYFKRFISQKSALPPAMGDWAGWATNNALPRESQDLMVARHVKVGNVDFIGVFNSWFHIKGNV